MFFTLTELADVFENLSHFHCDDEFDAISSDEKGLHLESSVSVPI